MLPKTLSFVDCETTGMSPQYGRIIEIGIIKTENHKIIDQFSSLINPQMTVDPFIKSLTGITQEDLENAPSFYEVSDRIAEILSGSVVVAHNALFDYMFIKKEFERLEKEFSAKYCCSVKLSRNLYPRFKKHNLDAIIKRLNLACANRHRAFDDAKVIFDFYTDCLQNKGEEKLAQAFGKVMKRPTLPVGIKEEILETLSENCGVYTFYNKIGAPLYIGKSLNLKDRVMSHFSNSKRANVDMKIVQEVCRVEVIETAGELGALLLEATMVKKMQPLYNRQLRYAYKLLALKKVINSQSYNSVEICNLQDIPVTELNQILAIFKSKKDLRKFLQDISKENNLCPKLLGIEDSAGNCFNFHLNLCSGACSGKEIYLKYNLRFDEAFYKTKIKDWPFKGPIALKEKSKKEEVFIIDKWCVLGKLKDENESLEDVNSEYLFDTDTYKILNRYLRSNKDFEIYNLQSRS